MKRTNGEILSSLQNEHGFIPQRRRYLQQELHAITAKYNMPTELEIDNETVAGWYNSPKGLLQVLYERGFIDIDNLSKYSKNGKKINWGKTVM